MYGRLYLVFVRATDTSGNPTWTVEYSTCPTYMNGLNIWGLIQQGMADALTACTTTTGGAPRPAGYPADMGVPPAGYTYLGMVP